MFYTLKPQFLHNFSENDFKNYPYNIQYLCVNCSLWLIDRDIGAQNQKSKYIGILISQKNW